MILFYTDELNPRIEYTARLIFNHILNAEIKFTTNSSEFLKSDLPKMNYSYEKFDDEIYIKPHRLMYCKALIQPDIQTVWYQQKKFFFESSNDSVFPFDPISATFYLVTRYEEYLEKDREKFKRYPGEKSILAKYNLLKKPVVNIWADMLAKKLKEKFPVLEFPPKKPEYVCSIDIDNAWAYRHKGPWRGTGALLKAFSTGKLTEAKKRIDVWRGKMKDPYDTYAFIDNTFKGNEDKALFFFLVGDYKRYDKNISHKNRSYRKLIQETARKYTTGIHPSYSSSKKKGRNRLISEIRRLEGIISQKPLKSRQHFLRLKFPRTYRRLIKAGIKEDYTMGYAAQTGFRAGICTPYPFFDLKKEKSTPLMIFPFQVMDVTLNHYMGLSPEEAVKEVNTLMDEVKKAGGTFISIWHNETLNDTGPWKGYRKVFEIMNKKGFEWAHE